MHHVLHAGRVSSLASQGGLSLVVTNANQTCQDHDEVDQVAIPRCASCIREQGYSTERELRELVASRPW